MISVSFDGCFGQLHEAAGDTAVILCAAQGFEQLSAHRGWRELADLFAARGYPALRFDWRGCGDSLGGDDEPDRLGAWDASLHNAISFARRQMGCRRIVLVGLRFGATLAAAAAARAGGVDGLVMLGPVVSGRLYARELAGLAKVMAPVAPDVVADGLSIGGFRISAATLEAMKALDLRSLPAAPASRALVLAPPGQIGLDDAIAHLRAKGCDAMPDTFHLYNEWLAEPTFSQTPAKSFARAVDWIARTVEPGARVRFASPFPARLEGEHFLESGLTFGPKEQLFGVLSEPRDRPSSAGATIFVNAGANPHIGWARMNVEGARLLARSGYASLRMDVAGLGDSSPLPGRNPQIMYDLKLREDVSSAIDMLESRGYSNFTVVGLCSGAHTAFHAALADARITSLVMVNLQKFIWRTDYSLAVALRQAYRSTGSYQRGALRLHTYRRLLRGQIDVKGIAREMARRAKRSMVAKAAALKVLFRPGDDEASHVRRWFRELTDRSVQILLVYSADDAGLDELARHLGPPRKAFRAMSGVEMSVLEDADHNLTQRSARERFFAALIGFLAAGAHHADARPPALVGIKDAAASTHIDSDPEAAVFSRDIGAKTAT